MGLAALGLTGAALDLKSKTVEINNTGKILNIQKNILPEGLQPGDLVAVTAPASATNSSEIAPFIRALKKNGLKLVIGDTVAKQSNQYRYFSAPDEVRRDEFMQFVKNPDVKAILCARGGYGSMRILDGLDYNAIIANPKIIVGYSDITALIIAIRNMTGLVTYHGPVANEDIESFTMSYFGDILFKNGKNDPVELPFVSPVVINEGNVEGEIIGGNLTMITSTMGTPYEIQTEKKILFFEDTIINAYEFDRMLTQLHLAGKLEKAAALVFGTIKNLDQRRPFYPNRGYSIREVIENISKPLGIPVIIGLPAGHIDKKVTIPFGVTASLSTHQKKLTILEKSVN